MKKHFAHIAIIIVCTWLGILIPGSIDTANPDFSHGDFTYYRQMADAAPGLSEEVLSPFGYRIAGPWLAGTLFPDSEIGFEVLNTAALIVIPLLLYLLFIGSGISRVGASAFAISAAFNRYFFSQYAWNTYHLPDTWIFLILIAFWIFLKRKNYLPAALLIPVGIFFKEYAFLMIPVLFAVLIIGKEKIDKFLSAGVASVSAIVISIILNRTLNLPGDTVSGEFSSTLLSELSDPLAIPKRLIIAFTPFGLLPFIFFRQFLNFCRRNPHYALFMSLVLAGSFFGDDAERLAVTALPVYLIFIAELADRLTEKFTSVRRRNWLIQIVIVSGISSLYHIWGIVRLPDRTTSILFTAAILLLTASIFLYLIIIDKRISKPEKPHKYLYEKK